jgi:hypothetical protein
LVTAALSVTVVPNRSCDGANGTNEIECAVDATIVIGVDRTDVAEAAVDEARISTVTPGFTGGAT